MVLTLVLPVLYCLSTGPAVWLFTRDLLPSWADVALRWFYLPLDWVAPYLPDWVVDAWEAYTNWWEPSFEAAFLDDSLPPEMCNV